MVARLLTLIIGLTSLSCFTQGETTCGQENAGRAPMRGRVVDARTGQPLEGSLVFVELCELYSDNPDPSKGHPNYRYGALTKADGTFEVEVPKGSAGLHTFLSGYRYGALAVGDTTAANIEVRAEPLLPEDAKPVVMDLRVLPNEVKPGEELSLSATVRASSPKDPLSDEVLILEPTTNVARALDPPRRGVPGKAFPDGQWVTRLRAPSMPGNYTYLFGVTSEHCIVGEILRAQVTVR